MNICKACGANNLDTDLQCKECGSALPVKEQNRKKKEKKITRTAQPRFRLSGKSLVIFLGAVAVVAAIAAAIAMAESESNGIKFRVVPFKRK